MNTVLETPGELLRVWRQRRRLSQLDLALEAQVSQRHLSFVESGRALPSREMILRLARHLDIPLRERNVLLLAAGLAPVYPQCDWQAPELAAARGIVERLLSAHAPHPALAVDRHWTLLMANDAVGRWMRHVTEPALLQPPVNVLRVSLHPGGLAPHVGNLAEWRAHVLHRLDRQVAQAPDPTLAALRNELAGYPVPDHDAAVDTALSAIAVPLVLRFGGPTLRFLSTTTVFGTPTEVSLSELAIETFFPADDGTARAMRETPP